MATKASFNPDLAKQGGGGSGPEKGIFRVKTAKLLNHKTDFKPNQMYLSLGLEVRDSNNQAVRDAEDVTLNLSFGEKSLTNYHPALAKSHDDADPVDQGANPDAEGNTLCLAPDKDAATVDPFSGSCGAMVFLATLKKQGFPEEIINRSFTPDLVGMEFELASLKSAEVNTKFGTRLNTKPSKDEKGNEITFSYKVVNRWLNPNYLSAPGQVNNASTSGQENVAAPEAVDDLAKIALQAVVTTKKGTTIKSPQALFGFVTNVYAQSGGKNAAITVKLPAKRLSEVQAKVKDMEWVGSALAELGAVPEFNEQGEPTGAYSIPA